MLINQQKFNMKKLDIVESTKEYMSGILFRIQRIGEKRVSLEIVKPTPNKDGFVVKKFKTGNIEKIYFYKKRTITRQLFNELFKEAKKLC
jgi:hypothetical protein